MRAVTVFRLLGPFEVVRDGRVIDLGGPRQRAVLAMLLLDAGRVVSTDRLVENLWGSDPPPSMLGSLQVYVSHLRRALRDEERATSPLVRRAPGYLVDVDPADVDLTPFGLGCEAALAAVDDRDWAAATESARGALGHVRGPLLADFGDEEWVRLAAVAIDERRRACAQALVTGLLGLGRVADALVVSGGLVVDQPMAERSCWLHMVGLYRAGRVGDALAAYRAHVRALDDDLGLDPGPALRDLHAAVLRQDRELERWPNTPEQAEVPGIVQPEQPAAPGLVPPELAGRVFVGRDRELATLVELLDRSRPAGTRWIMLTGPAGIGKTRLAEEAAAGWVAGGGDLSRARCPDDEGVPPWWPLRQVLRDLGHDPADVLRVTEGSHADTARYEAYDRVVDLLVAAAAARPLLVLVDDVQWADPMSLRFLTHLLDTVDVPGLALVLTARDVRPSRELTRLLGGLARRAGARQLALPPLSSDEVAELAAAVGGHDIDAAAARRLTVRTGGNPFFVSEYARLTDEQLAAGETPNAIRSVLRLRLSGLDADVLTVLEAAAVAGSVLDIPLLCAVTGQGRDALADRLDDAADVHLLVVDPGGAYTFPHALLRDEILAGLSPGRRRRLNLAVAEALGTAPAGEALGKRAAHLVAALPLADARTALEACRAAAQDAEQAWQSEAAAGWWELALQALDRTADATSTERDDLTVALVAAYARSGRSQTVLDTVDAALLDAVRAGRTASAGRLAAVLLRTSGSWPWVVYGDDAGPLLARLDGLVDHVVDDPAARARILAALAVGRSYEREQERDRLGRAAIEIAEGLGDPEVLADALLGRALSICGIAAHAHEIIEILDRLAATPHGYAQIDAVIAQGILFNARMALGDPACADHVRIGATGSDMLRLPISRMQMRWADAQLHHWRGDDLAAAESLYEQAMAAHRRTELYESSVLDIARLSLRWDQGRLAEFPELADVDAHVLPWARAMVAVATGADEADDLVRAGAARDAPHNWMLAAQLTMGAHAVADRGLRELAAPLRARMEPLAGYIANIGLVGTMGTVALALARLCVLDGDLDAARRHLATARQISERAGGRLSALRTRLVAAELDADTGSVDVDELATIAREAARRGMRGVERRALALLDAHPSSR